MELTEEQKAARAVGMSKGVPEEFAINCKAIALVDIEIGGREYKAGTRGVPFYDSRIRDRMRKHRMIIVQTDVLLIQTYPGTIAPAQQVQPEVENGTTENGPSETRGPRKARGNGPRNAG